MPDAQTDATVAEPEEPEATDAASEVVVEEELLVEDVSIDGMCGVY